MALAGLVPPVYGAFDVDIGDLHMHCFVTMAVDKTLDDQLLEWRKRRLTPVLAREAINLVIRVLLFMVYAAGEMEVACSHWHVGNIGMKEGRLYLIDWGKTRKADMTSVYRRIKPAIIAFLKWLPGLHLMKAGHCSEEPEQTWLVFLELIQSYLIQDWWPSFYGCDRLPTEEDMEEVREHLCATVGTLISSSGAAAGLSQDSRVAYDALCLYGSSYADSRGGSEEADAAGSAEEATPEETHAAESAEEATPAERRESGGG